MALNAIAGKPGTQTGFSATPVEIFYGTRPQSPDGFIPGPVTVDGNYASDPGNTPYTWLVRAGGLVHRDSTSGKYRTSILGATSAQASSTITSLTVTANTASEVARQIVVAAGNVTILLVGGSTANGAVNTQSLTATAASGTTITVSSQALGQAFVSGSLITIAAPTTVVCDQWGLKVIDSLNTTRVDVYDSELYAGKGILDESKFINWPTDTGMQAWIKAGLRTNFPGAVFKGDIINS